MPCFYHSRLNNEKKHINESRLANWEQRYYSESNVLCHNDL